MYSVRNKIESGRYGWLKDFSSMRESLQKLRKRYSWEKYVGARKKLDLPCYNSMKDEKKSKHDSQKPLLTDFSNSEEMLLSSSSLSIHLFIV